MKRQVIFYSVKYLHILVIFNSKSSIQNSQFFIYSEFCAIVDVFRFLLINFFHVIILSDFLTLSWFELCWSVCGSLGSLALHSGVHGPPGGLPAALRPALLPLLGKTPATPAVLLQVKILVNEWQNAVLLTSPHFCAWVLNITIRKLFSIRNNCESYGVTTANCLWFIASNGCDYIPNGCTIAA